MTQIIIEVTYAEKCWMTNEVVVKSHADFEYFNATIVKLLADVIKTYLDVFEMNICFLWEVDDWTQEIEQSFKTFEWFKDFDKSWGG